MGLVVTSRNNKPRKIEGEVVPDDQPKWIKPLIDGYKNGYSDVEVCRELDITLKVFNLMYQENEGFRKLVDYGRMMQQAWWMEQGRKNLWNKDFSVSLWNFNMKNRFGWADKTETKNSDADGAGSVNIDDLRTRMAKALPKLIKQFEPELADARLLEQLSQGKDITNEAN